MPIVYGRRRVGKSRLIREFCQGQRVFFYVGLEQSREAALINFFEALLTQLPSPISGLITTFPDWTKAFHYLTEFAMDERLVVVIYEYPYLAKSDPSIASRYPRPSLSATASSKQISPVAPPAHYRA